MAAFPANSKISANRGFCDCVLPGATTTKDFANTDENLGLVEVVDNEVDVVGGTTDVGVERTRLYLGVRGESVGVLCKTVNSLIETDACFEAYLAAVLEYFDRNDFGIRCVITPSLTLGQAIDGNEINCAQLVPVIPPSGSTFSESTNPSFQS
ncbi:hypothetical protein BDR06DRAFT_1014560 [Suillus hirtellus]|nr:hypothetical protein BDR06DRAFT_1014560 [Suillus hirtellus]